MHQNLRLCLGFIRTIRYWLLIETVILADRFSPTCANWIGERSGLNDALRAYLAISDRREDGSGPPSALQAKS